MVFEDAALAEMVRAAQEAKAVAEEAAMKAGETLARAASALAEVTTLRDAADVLGYSHQYVAKLSRKQ
jgi:hypothetical protein